MLNIVLFGPPGAGKGTQSELIIKKYDLVHFSTGDILRAEIKAQSALGLKAKQFMDKGELVTDEIVIGMIENKIEQNKNAKGFIFDGFPRTSAHAVALDKILINRNIPISGMIALEVPKDELISRLLLRGKDSGRADDQDQTIIENRIKVYNNETAPVIDYYAKQNKYISILGVGSIEEIFSKIASAIDAK
ncbi:MAG: adenylate kinase [Bacteroidales bacterium]|nr:adenylate kinase [Bacteroidales bacterium]